MKLCLLALALAVLSCSGAPKPDPIAAAEAACHVETKSVLATGACDDYAAVEACPAFMLAMVQCRMWLNEAQRELEK